MGSHNFDTIVWTEDDLGPAYQAAVSEALHEGGHDPYNGTISTTEGVCRSPLAGREPTPENQIDQEAVDERLDHLNKWENCEAIPVYRVVPAKTKAHAQIVRTVKVPAETIGTPEQHKAVKDALTRMIRKEVRDTQAVQRDPQSIGQTLRRNLTDSVALPKPAKDYAVFVSREQVRPQPKAITAATPGTAETRHFVVPAGDTRMPRWETGYPTQAKARESLPKTFTNLWGDGKDEQWEIFSMTRRDEGGPLVAHTVTRKPGKTIEVAVVAEVTEVLEAERITTDRGWYFYGWAAS